VNFAIPESKQLMATKRVSEKKTVVSGSAAAAPARRKSVTPKRVTHSVSASEEPSTPQVVSVDTVVEIQSVEISNEAVAQLAYSYWVARGYQGGSPEEDWLRAEQELRATASK
jgi:Protein of unknown function (DUF2934)